MKPVPEMAGVRVHRRKLLAACGVLWVAALVATHVPGSYLPGARVSDKLLHLVGYFLLAGVLWATLGAHGLGRGGRVFWTLVAMTAYAGLDECTQPLFGRDLSLGDWLADVAGAVAATAVAEVGAHLHRRTRRRT